MDNQYLIRIAWPAKPLWQNRRGHWGDVRKSTRLQREEAWAEARAAAVAKMPGAILEFAFHPPDNRKRDIQNMPATVKGAIDGIADAMGCDDSGFKPIWPQTFANVVKGGCVLIQVKQAVQNIELRGIIT